MAGKVGLAILKCYKIKTAPIKFLYFAHESFICRLLCSFNDLADLGGYIVQGNFRNLVQTSVDRMQSNHAIRMQSV